MWRNVKRISVSSLRNWGKKVENNVKLLYVYGKLKWNLLKRSDICIFDVLFSEPIILTYGKNACECMLAIFIQIQWRQSNKTISNNWIFFCLLLHTLHSNIWDIIPGYFLLLLPMLMCVTSNVRFFSLYSNSNSAFVWFIMLDIFRLLIQ